MKYGDAGDDFLHGGNDDDNLHGGKGSDRLYGQRGQDTFVLVSGEGLDTIADFEDGTDLIGLVDLAFDRN